MDKSGAASCIFAVLALSMALNGCGDGTGDGDIPDDVATDQVSPQDFDIRIPEQESLECNSFGSYFLAQLDYVCRIDNDRLTADLYLQSSPTDCGEYGNPTYVPDGAWLKIDDTVVSVPGGYDYGGRHHNDLISFTYNNTPYRIGHSSIGYGWRPCTNPDCLVVCEADADCAAGGTEEVDLDGCLREAGDPPPALQVICVEVTADGTLPAFEDPWTTQSPYADEGVMILPCLGEDSTAI